MVAVETLFYILFVICVIHPPTEFVSAGFTIEQIFDNYLGSENVNFVEYHIRRITFTVLIHALLLPGYILTLWLGGLETEWLPCMAIGSCFLPMYAVWKIISWWEYDRKNNPIVMMLSKYTAIGSSWKIVAAHLNVDFRNVDKVSIQLSATSKFIVTETFLIKVMPYQLLAVPQSDCALVATATDTHSFTQSGEDEIQYVNVEVIPTTDDLPRFSFRVTAPALREIQLRLSTQIRMPEHLTLQPTLIERFVLVFKLQVEENPVYFIDEMPELCIGCMQAPADVKINNRCEAPAEPEPADPPCQQCNCRVLWCCSCLARWWAARAAGPPPGWLAGRGSCPVCRAVFCMLDVCPARRAP